MSVPDAHAFSEIRYGDHLPNALRDALTALSACNVTTSTLAAAGFSDPKESGQLPLNHALRCFSIARWSDEGPFIALYLRAVDKDSRVSSNEFMMIATHDGERWRFTWPADVGPAKLGRD